MATGITFDSNNLQTTSIITNTINHAGLPNKRAVAYALSHSNASNIPFTEYTGKTITITGTLVASDIPTLDALIDTFNGYFVNKDANLDIDYNSGTRRYICTVTAMSIDRPGNLAWADFSVTFACTQPFGQNTSTTSAVSASARTSSSYNDNHTFLGSSPVQRVIATITLNTVTDASGGHIVFGNNATGQKITVQRTWANGDVLVIDCGAKTVTVNGTTTDFSGAFPLFGSGAQTITYLDNLTARNFNISVVYYPLFL